MSGRTPNLVHPFVTFLGASPLKGFFEVTALLFSSGQSKGPPWCGFSSMAGETHLSFFLFSAGVKVESRLCVLPWLVFFSPPPAPIPLCWVPTQPHGGFSRTSLACGAVAPSRLFGPEGMLAIFLRLHPV